MSRRKVQRAKQRRPHQDKYNEQSANSRNTALNDIEDMVVNGIRNVGSRSKGYRYEGKPQQQQNNRHPQNQTSNKGKGKFRAVAMPADIAKIFEEVFGGPIYFCYDAPSVPEPTEPELTNG